MNLFSKAKDLFDDGKDKVEDLFLDGIEKAMDLFDVGKDKAKDLFDVGKKKKGRDLLYHFQLPWKKPKNPYKLETAVALEW
ncbi:hypothetical protein FRX31_007161 [Thalictrum thalictroides]|uniref:Uncharacterized protein n=1 Tax=Thalictrum thalictroides TaxID=46969 RepID=A0A7J6X4F2_THATH|nr:hypothetical protein FRX31_007161 [Thalictrum thalictroides]